MSPWASLVCDRQFLSLVFGDLEVLKGTNQVLVCRMCLNLFLFFFFFPGRKLVILVTKMILEIRFLKENHKGKMLFSLHFIKVHIIST